MKILLTSTIIFVAQLLIAQTKEYKITPEITADKVARYSKGTFAIYEVSLQTVEIPTYDTAYVETIEYQNITAKIQNLKLDSLEINKEYLNEMSDFKEVSSIRNNIVEFLESRDKFKDKKHLLLQAQTTAKKFNIDVFIYSDKTINRVKTAEFFKMRVDGKELFDHLNQIQRDLRHTIREPLAPASFKFTALTNARKQRDKVVRHETKLSKSGSFSQEAIVKGNQITDLTSISGIYKMVGDNSKLVEVISLFDGDSEGDSRINKVGRNSNLIEEVSSGVLYYDLGRLTFLYTCGSEMSLVNFMAKLSDLGFSTEQKGEDVLINNTRVKLTSNIYKEVSAGNIDYLHVLMSSAKKLNALLVEATPLTDKLANHFNAWQHGTLSSTRLEIWKKEVTKSQDIISKIRKLPNIDKYSLGDFTTTERLEMYVEFVPVVSGSANILGL